MHYEKKKLNQIKSMILAKKGKSTENSVVGPLLLVYIHTINIRMIKIGLKKINLI